MRKKFFSADFGKFVDDQIKDIKMSMNQLCKAIQMGKATYTQLKSGWSRPLSDYVKTLDLLFDSMSEEEFREIINKWVSMYIDSRNKRKEGEK